MIFSGHFFFCRSFSFVFINLNAGPVYKLLPFLFKVVCSPVFMMHIDIYPLLYRKNILVQTVDRTQRSNPPFKQLEPVMILVKVG